MARVVKEIRCRMCGKFDNDWEERSGLCLDCYCKELLKHVFDNVSGRHPSLEEASKMIKKEAYENSGLSTI